MRSSVLVAKILDRAVNRKVHYEWDNGRFLIYTKGRSSPPLVFDPGICYMNGEDQWDRLLDFLIECSLDKNIPWIKFDRLADLI
jgi:hypothetical protein